MKKILLSLILLSFLACSDSDDDNLYPLKFNPSDYTFAQEGGKKNITISGMEPEYWKIESIKTIEGGVENSYTTPRDYVDFFEEKIYVKKSWFTISKNESNTKYDFTVKLNKNEQKEDRTIEIRFLILDSSPSTLVLHQKGTGTN